MRLFTVNGEEVTALSACSFQSVHNEERIQKWAEACPALLNDGIPMLSLGTEIPTQHNYSIDNLYLDSNGLLVAAELKRGRTPRDVVAQVLDYAAYISRLEWQDVEAICARKRHKSLDEAYREVFGYSLKRTPRPQHRLIVMAESYDPRTLDAAIYLINGGLPLALVAFTFFNLQDRAVLNVQTVLGQIPGNTLARTSSSALQAEHQSEGYAPWLMGSVAQALPEITSSQGWPLRFRLNKASVSFGSDEWPVTIGDCQLRVDLFNSKKLALRLAFRKEALPSLQEFLEARTTEWQSAFPAAFENPKYPTAFANLTRHMAPPALGDQAALAPAIDTVRSMAGALVPLLDSYFAHQEPL